jgi:hypothetical protein
MVVVIIHAGLSRLARLQVLGCSFVKRRPGCWAGMLTNC